MNLRQSTLFRLFIGLMIITIATPLGIGFGYITGGVIGTFISFKRALLINITLMYGISFTSPTIQPSLAIAYNTGIIFLLGAIFGILLQTILMTWIGYKIFKPKILRRININSWRPQ